MATYLGGGWWNDGDEDYYDSAAAIGAGYTDVPEADRSSGDSYWQDIARQEASQAAQAPTPSGLLATAPATVQAASSGLLDAGQQSPQVQRAPVTAESLAQQIKDRWGGDKTWTIEGEDVSLPFAQRLMKYGYTDLDKLGGVTDVEIPGGVRDEYQFDNVVQVPYDATTRQQLMYGDKPMGYLGTKNEEQYLGAPSEHNVPSALAWLNTDAGGAWVHAVKDPATGKTVLVPTFQGSSDIGDIRKGAAAIAALAANAIVPGAGQALGSALGIGTTAGTALAGAGYGAATGALGGGTKGALIGGITGGVGGYMGGSAAEAAALNAADYAGGLIPDYAGMEFGAAGTPVLDSAGQAAMESMISPPAGSLMSPPEGPPAPAAPTTNPMSAAEIEAMLAANELPQEVIDQVVEAVHAPGTSTATGPGITGTPGSGLELSQPPHEGLQTTPYQPLPVEPEYIAPVDYGLVPTGTTTQGITATTPGTGYELSGVSQPGLQATAVPSNIGITAPGADGGTITDRGLIPGNATPNLGDPNSIVNTAVPTTPTPETSFWDAIRQGGDSFKAWTAANPTLSRGIAMAIGGLLSGSGGGGGGGSGYKDSGYRPTITRGAWTPAGPSSGGLMGPPVPGAGAPATGLLNITRGQPNDGLWRYLLNGG